ncbi:MAG TPA: DNA polymerase III subunit delta' [Burkholderiaceae bacterium]|nr:DNA polymerase III subunit delta' [Burkholderiaceae bacterium]
MSDTTESVSALEHSAPKATPLASWIATQTASLLQQRGHAWLLQGPSGLGQYELALQLVRAWLCDAPTAAGACGVCTSCHGIDVRTHADVCVLMPETVMLELGWPLSEKAQEDIDEKKRKPSKEIRIDAMREAVEFAQRTASRGRGKAMLVYPAERMNHITANALLKTLEEPPGDLKFVLASEAAHQLLPTIRSRCLTHTMRWPNAAESTAWLTEQGIKAADAPALLRAAGQRPADALLFAQTNRSPSQWQAFPKAMAQGDVALVAKWLPAELLDAQQKLCHDLMTSKAGATPRFFNAADLPLVKALPSYSALTQWQKALNATAKTVEHPFNAGLMIEAMVSEAKRVMGTKEKNANV